jgi:RHS repeat-associated protein
MKVGTNYYFYHNDHLGTPQKMTAVNGAVVWSAKYEAFGRATVDSGATVENNLRFPGQYYDAETGENYNLNRYYETQIGRYISNDPIENNGDGNLYSFVANSPLNNIDMLGLSSRKCQKEGYVPPTNECGPQGGWLNEIVSILVPERPLLIILSNVDFGPACDNHDTCYGTCNRSQQACDDAFKSKIIDICEDKYANNPTYRKLCEKAGDLYHKAVSSKGGKSWQAGQDAACTTDCPCIEVGFA